MLLLMVYLYQDTVLYLVGVWNQLETGEYAHGYLVLAISAFLVVSDRKKLTAVQAMPNFWGLVAIAACSLLWMLGAISDVMLIQAVFLVLAFTTLPGAMWEQPKPSRSHIFRTTLPKIRDPPLNREWIGILPWPCRI